MKVKTFHALTMQDAIRAIKEALGPEAIILSSKEVRHGGRLLRLFNRPVLEVVAAAEEEQVWATAAAPKHSPSATPPAPAPTPAPLDRTGFHETLQSLLKPAGPAAVPPSVTPAQAATRGWKQRRLRQLRAELQEVGRLLAASLPPEAQALGGHLATDVATCCRGLIAQGLRPATAESLGHDLGLLLDGPQRARPDAVRETMQRLLAERIRVSGPLSAGRGGRTVSVLLGPSGAGKTTAMTKLAAQYRLEEKKSVALITFDTYRQTALDHVRMYAGVLGVPVASAVSAHQVHAGLRRYAHADVVLIDMAGIAPNEVAAATELQRLLKQDATIDVHLVVPASMRELDLFRLYERVKHLPLLRLLFTKLDETAAFGTLFELSHQTGVPLSYWSVGQRVPEDLEVATPERLAAFLTAQRYVDANPIVRSSRSSSCEYPEAVGAATGRQER